MTFQEVFTQMGLEDSIVGQWSYILDAPDAIFNAMKEQLATTFAADFDVKNLLKEISGNEDIDISQTKAEIVEAYNTVEDTLLDEGLELPKDRVEFLLDLLNLIKNECLALPERKMVEIVVEKINEDAILPTYAHKTDAGADVYANEEVEIPGNTTVIVKTGIKMAIPEGWEVQIRPRSGMSAKTPIRIANAPGTIDSGYRDEVGIICHNTSPYSFTIHKGDRIAQMLPRLCPMISWIEGKVNQVEGDRKGGFGSTGN